MGDIRFLYRVRSVSAGEELMGVFDQFLEQASEWAGPSTDLREKALQLKKLQQKDKEIVQQQMQGQNDAQNSSGDHGEDVILPDE